MAKLSLPDSVHILGPTEGNKWSTRPNSESRMQEKKYSNPDKSKQLLQAPNYSEGRIYAVSLPVRLAVLRENLLKPAEQGGHVLFFSWQSTSISSHGPIYHATGIEVGFCPVSFDPENESNSPKKPCQNSNLYINYTTMKTNDNTG